MANTKAIDGTPIPKDVIIELWEDIGTLTHLTITTPNSTSRMVQSGFAKRRKKHE